MSDSLSQTKRQALLHSGTLHPRADRVVHSLFEEHDFFDPHDLLQVKYEALRCWQLREHSLSEIARQFGMSRPTLYSAKAAFENRGLEGLLPSKRGPKGAHKLTSEVVSYLDEALKNEPELKADDLAIRLQQQFELHVHPRSVERVLGREQISKKGLQT